MKVTVDVMNGDTHKLDLPMEAVYGDVLEEVGLNPEAAVVVVDGRPQPEDEAVEEDEVRVMRTVSGGGTAHTLYFAGKNFWVAEK